MINSLHLNKLKIFIIFFVAFTFNFAFGEEEAADIWKKKENKIEQENQTETEEEITIESPILSEDIKKITIEIDANRRRWSIYNWYI